MTGHEIWRKTLKSTFEHLPPEAGRVPKDENLRKKLSEIEKKVDQNAKFVFMGNCGPAAVGDLESSCRQWRECLMEVAGEW